jgi:hypothetical protein
MVRIHFPPPASLRTSVPFGWLDLLVIWVGRACKRTVKSGSQRNVGFRRFSPISVRLSEGP